MTLRQRIVLVAASALAALLAGVALPDRAKPAEQYVICGPRLSEDCQGGPLGDVADVRAFYAHYGPGGPGDKP